MDSNAGLMASAQLKVSKLTMLPAETLEHIASYLYQPSQLNNLSMTCKHLNSVIRPRLYRELSIVLPRSWSSAMFLEGLLGCGAEGLQHTKGITIFMKCDTLGVPSASYNDDDDGLNLDTEGDWAETTDELGQKHYQPRILNTLMRLLIDRLPINRLETFRWCHTTRISANTIELVGRRHGRSLKTLQIYNTSTELWLYKSDFSALTNFDAGDIDLYMESTWISKVVAFSHKSLRHVKFGCERNIALSYLGKRNLIGAGITSDFTEDFAADLRSELLKAATEPQTSLLTVESLHLVGIDCNFSPSIGESTMVDIDKLTSLCLESCFNLGQSFPALSSLRSPDAPQLLPQLRTFRLRHEGSDASFKDMLKAFLLALKGLVHLAVLLEGSGPFLPPDCFVGNHGPTLQTLVWDQRRGPRKKLDESTNTATEDMMFSSLNEIAKKCPNLRELGLASLTDNDYYEDSEFHPYGVYRLKHLKTLNIHTLPGQKADARTSCFQRIHASIATNVANTLLSWGSRIETLGLGSITWTDIWQGRSRVDSYPVEQYLCPRIFHIEYPVNLRGNRQPLVTQIAQGTATEAKEYSSDLRVFESYWLG